MWRVPNDILAKKIGKIALVTALTSVLGSVTYYFYQKRKKPAIPINWDPVGHVTDLYVYPLKSGKRISLDRAECTRFGIQICEQDENTFRIRDRTFLIYGEDDLEFKSAKVYPKMVLIGVSVYSEDRLCFEAPGIRQLFVKIPNIEDKNITVTLKVGEKKIQALDCGNEAAAWVSRYLIGEDRKVRLAYFNINCEENIQAYPNYSIVYPELNEKSLSMLGDLISCLLINEASVDDVVNRSKDTSITHNNFRPNIVIKGPAAFAEDYWDFIKVGDVVFRKILPCTRCIITTIDPVEGRRKINREPLRTLEKYRTFEREPFKSLFGREPAMGIYLQTIIPGKFNRRDKIYIGRD